jgi:hypothetical protein
MVDKNESENCQAKTTEISYVSCQGGNKGGMPFPTKKKGTQQIC